jgi:hypothetical protein
VVQLASDSIAYAWTSTISGSISVVATLSNNTALTASVSFNTAQPNVQATATELGVVIVPAGVVPTCPGLTGTSMCLFGNGPPGIAFSYTGGLSPGDQYEWVQIVNSSVIDQTDSSGKVCEANTSGLDGGKVYFSQDGVNAADSPGITLANPPYVEVTRSDKFSMFLMYMPRGGIFVPLYQVNWKSWTSTNPPEIIKTSSYPTWVQANNPNAPCNPKQ